MQRPTPSKSTGFTLIELVIVMTILTIIAGIATPRMGKVIDKAKLTTAESELKAIAKALGHLYEDMGAYPRDVGRGVDPGLFDRNRVPANRAHLWNGPYLEGWPAESPWAGEYDYGYGTTPEFNFDGLSGNEVMVSIRAGDMDAATMAELDAQMDDGNGATGLVRHSATNHLWMFVTEGPRW